MVHRQPVGRGPHLAMPDKAPVGQVGPEPPLVPLDALHPFRVKLHEEREDHEDGDQQKIIGRDDPQEPAGIEVLEAVGRLPSFQQYPRDQEAGQREKDVHANPAKLEKRGQLRVRRHVPLQPEADMEQHHREDGYASQSVQCGKMLVQWEWVPRANPA